METSKKIILLALTVVMMAGCIEKNDDGSFHAPKSNVNTSYFLTIIIDSCEYIKGVSKIAHKGNCKFCAKRREKEIKELVELLKEK